jgi:hypothetical protein
VQSLIPDRAHRGGEVRDRFLFLAILQGLLPVRFGVGLADTIFEERSGDAEEVLLRGGVGEIEKNIIGNEKKWLSSLISVFV